MATFGKYLKEAFSAKPLGMFIPPNWVALAGFGLLGAAVDPAFFVLGAGLELAYLLTIATNARFQKVVDGKELLQAQQAGVQRQTSRLSSLTGSDQQRYRALENRCRSILEQQRSLDISASDLRGQADGLARLNWIYLGLLITRQNIHRVLGESLDIASEKKLQQRIEGLNNKVKGSGGGGNEKLTEDLKKSLAGQIEILQQRMEKQREARDKLAFIDAELTRIEEQVELIREQAAVSADPKGVSDRIDAVAADLTGRSEWLKEQQQVYGKVEDILNEPPPPIDMTVRVPPLRQ